MPIGNHIYKSNPILGLDGRLNSDIARAKIFDVTMGCAQLFVIGPRNTHENLSPGGMKSLKDLADKSGVDLIVHGSYLDNPWSPTRGKHGIHLIRRELQLCDMIGAKALVIHLPRESPKAIADVLVSLLHGRDGSPGQTALYLEIESYKASQYTYETGAKLQTLFSQIVATANEKNLPAMKAVGLVLDTAHAWAAGVRLASRQEAKAWLDEIMAQPDIPHGRIAMHLNDQKWELGAGRDEHAPLGYGTIWGNYHPCDGTLPFDESGLMTILDWIEEHNINAILERKDDKPKINGKPLIDNIDSDYKLIGGAGFFSGL